MSDVSAGTAASPSQHPSGAPRRAGPDDLRALTRTLAAAFYDDPVFGWLLPDEERRSERLRRFFDLELRLLALPSGEVWTTPQVAGAAMSLPAHAWRLPLHRTLPHGLAYTRAFGVGLPRALALQLLMEHRHHDGPHYYFPFIGVAPEGQGQGLGTELMRPTLDRCDAEGVPAYLEASNERCAALYERLGFRQTGELRLAGSPPLRLMVRAPHADG